ncbi:hypothetical protein GW17_00043521 [Ensete ventricosum]|nr:hypothetical protein GW17_00043521 [Ensete ventricosum]
MKSPGPHRRRNLRTRLFVFCFVAFVIVLYGEDFTCILGTPFRRADDPPSPPLQQGRVPREKDEAVVPFAVGKGKTDEGCDVFAGEWVYDELSRPHYGEEECPYIQPQLTCQAHGRPDAGYQHWRWQPLRCSLPRRGDTKNVTEMVTEDAYRLALRRMLKWVEKNMDPRSTRVFFTSMSPSHHRLDGCFCSSKEWGGDPEGNCYNETTPIEDATYWGTSTSKSMMQVIGDVFDATGVPITLLNITQLSEYRKDAHTQIYKKQWSPLTPEQLVGREKEHGILRFSNATTTSHGNLATLESMHGDKSSSTSDVRRHHARQRGSSCSPPNPAILIIDGGHPIIRCGAPADEAWSPPAVPTVGESASEDYLKSWAYRWKRRQRFLSKTDAALQGSHVVLHHHSLTSATALSPCASTSGTEAYNPINI